ncbi:MAG: cell wall-binding repeat-containing protein, partial [Eggerthellaceae bacterium]|nr:cell wall-binding repeat-containing protein [Eggerthellaceae bacterium]
DIWSTEPNVNAYKAGTLSSESIAFSTSYLNFIRTAAGLGTIRFDSTLNKNAAQGGLIMARNKIFAHEQPVPDGVSEVQAAAGQYACNSSNISYSWGFDNVLEVALQGQMDDEDSDNMARVGHRRWLLNPPTSTFGIGTACASGSYYTAVRVLDQWGGSSEYGSVAEDNPTDYDFVAWPASGAFPNNVFGTAVPWSVSLNPSVFSAPELNKVKVTLVRESDGKTWTLDSSDNSAASTRDEYFNVNNSWIGVSNCIVFAPGYASLGANEYVGRYSVLVEGIALRDGSSAELSYTVNFTDARTPINAAQVTVSPSSVTYNGGYHTPSPTVTLDGKVLKEGTDYYTSFANNINAGTATVTVTGTGKYVGTVKGSFDIAPKSISAAQFRNLMEQTYDGSPKMQSDPWVLDGSTYLTKGMDFNLSYSNNVNAGNATIVATGEGNYTGSAKGIFVIAMRDISSASVAAVADKVYTGSAISPAPTVSYAGRTLKEGIDYTASYKSNVNAGTAIVTIAGKGNFKGSVSKTFKITPASIAKAAVSGLSDRTYTGVAQTQSPTVKVGSATLKEGADYTLSYKNNANVGTATVTVTGKGNYTGSVSKTFKIVPASIAKASVSGLSDRTYTGAAQTQSPTVKVGSATLRAGTDYTLSYKDNVAVGTATVTVTGKGNYTGSVSKTFKIKAVPKRTAWTRLWGAGPLDTMRAVVKAGWRDGCGGTVVVATSGGHYDALSAAGVAGLEGAPILMTNKKYLSAQTKAELQRIRPRKVIIAGGPLAVSTDVFYQIKAAAGVTPVRLYGADARATAAKLNTTYAKQWKTGKAILATSKSFHDALSAAPVAYAQKIPVFLVSGGTVDANTLAAMRTCGVRRVIVLGGTLAIPASVVDQLQRAGMSTARLWGPGPRSTSKKIADWGVSLGMSPNRMGVATTYSYYDALCGAALCGKNNSVLVLADDKGYANSAFTQAH